MVKIIFIFYVCYIIVVVGFSYLMTILLLFFILFFLVIGESIVLNYLLWFVLEIVFYDKCGLYFLIYGIYWDIFWMCGLVIGVVILSKLNGSMLFYICVSFLLVGGIV